MALLSWFEVPNDVLLTWEYNPANFRVIAIHLSNNNKRRRLTELKVKTPGRAEVNIKIVGNADAESFSVQGVNQTGILAADPDDGEVGMAPGTVVEFYPGKPTV